MRYLIIMLLCLAISKGVDAQTEQEIYDYMLCVGIKHPDVVLKQAIYETGHFKSHIFLQKNNLFGFRHKKYMVFDNWQACLDYYKVWQDKHYKNDSIDYYKFLEKLNFSGKIRKKYTSEIKHTKIKATVNCDVDEKNKQKQ